MVNFLNVVTHLLSRRPWTDLPATFGYTLNEPVPLPFSSVFTLYTGTNTSTGEEVSVFVYDKKNVTQDTRSASTLDTDSSMHFARNCLKHLRSIRHPYVLRVLEAVDVPSGIYVATEAVRPLCLSDVPPDPSWGLYQVITAVSFLHESCGSVHRLVSPFAVFVTVDGAHWRLGTFDCMQSTSALSTSAGGDDSNDNTLFLTHPLHTSDLRPPPNLSRSPLIDRWGLRSLVTWCYTHVGALLTEHQPQLNSTPIVPQSAKRLCRDLFKCSLHGTPSVSQKPLPLVLKENPLFAENALVGVMLFFEEFNLKGSWEKEKFFESLPNVLRETIPCKAQYLQILPQLAHQLNFYPRPELLLPSVLLIADQLQSCGKLVEPRALTNGHSTESCNKHETYQRHIIPVLLTFFKLPDRAVRAMLLQHLSSFETYLTVRDIEAIFDSLCLGFIDSFAALREATLRSMVYFVPKLTNPKLVDKAFQSISKLLHSDPEGALRTNAVICLAKLFPFFASQSQHAATFRSSLLRGLKDAFPPCRTATLMAIKVAVSSDAKNVFSREELMTRFAPIICHRCVDADTNVQLAAFSVLEHILNFTKTEAMPEPPHQTTAHGAVVLPVSASVPVSSTTRSPVRCSPSSAFSTKTHQGGATNIEFYATANYDATIASNCGALPSGPLRVCHKKTASHGTQKLSSSNSDGSSSILKSQVLLLNENDNDDEDALGGWGLDQHDFSDPKDTVNGSKDQGVNGNTHELFSKTQLRSPSVANLCSVESAKTTESSYFPVTRPAAMSTRQSATSVKESRPTFWDDFNVGDDESNEDAAANISTAGMLRSILAARNRTKEAVPDKN